MRGAFLLSKMQLPNAVLCAKRQTRVLIHKPRKLLTCLGLLGPIVRVGPWVQIHILAISNLCATYAHPMRNTSRIRREIRLLTLKGHCSRHSQRICILNIVLAGSRSRSFRFNHQNENPGTSNFNSGNELQTQPRYTQLFNSKQLARRRPITRRNIGL